MTSLALEAKGVVRRYGDSSGPSVVACAGVDLRVRKGEMIALIGPSGSGKSTLLHLLGALDTPDAGDVTLCGVQIAGMSEGKRAELRRDHLGFIFQSFYLVPTMTGLENIGLSAVVASKKRSEWEPRARELARALGVADLADRFPGDMSGGQQQRIAVGRALYGRPEVILADEPTGNLDQSRAKDVMRLLRQSVDSGEAGCCVLVTHSDRAAAVADRVVVLIDGQIRSQMTFQSGSSSPMKEEEERVEHLRAWLASTGY